VTAPADTAAMRKALRAHGLPEDADAARVRPDDPAAAPANSALIAVLAREAAGKAPLRLPAGAVHCSGLDFSGLAGLTVEGAGRGRTLLCDRATPEPVVGANRPAAVGYVNWYSSAAGSDALSVPAGEPVPVRGRCVYSWPWNWGAARSDRRRYVVRQVPATGTAARLDRAVEPFPDVRWKWTLGVPVKGGVPAGADRLSLEAAADGASFKVGSYACLTDGPAVNELFCEFLTVAAAGKGAVYFDRPARQGYADGLASLIPGPFADDLTLRGLSVGVSNYAGQAYAYFRACPGLTLDDVSFGRFGGPPAGGGVSVVASTGVTARGVRVDGSLGFNCCQAVSVNRLDAWTARQSNGYAGGLGGEEYVTDLRADDCDLGGLKFGALPGRSHSLTGVTVRGSGWAVGLAPETRAQNLAVEQSETWWVNEDGHTLSNVYCESPVFYRGRGAAITGGRFPAGLWLDPGSSGTAVLTPDTPYTDDSGGGWAVAGGRRATRPT
jgi:hypothetical protein